MDPLAVLGVLAILFFYIGLPIIAQVQKSRQQQRREGLGLPASLGGRAGVRPMEFRFRRTHVGDKEKVEAIEVEARGPYPPTHSAFDAAFVVSVHDLTDGEAQPVLSHVEAFQEPDTVVFQSLRKGLRIRPGYGLADWVSVGLIILPILHPPRKGERRLKAKVFLKSMEPVRIGEETQVLSGMAAHFLRVKSCINCSDQWEFTHTFSDKGYAEEAEDRQESRGLAVKLAIAVAMADGELADSEGAVIKEWIVRQISVFGEEKQAELKEIYNTAMREAYEDSANGTLSLRPITQRLNEIESDHLKYESIELCHEVMAADSVIDAEEMRTIRTLTEALGLDPDEIAKMRDRHLVTIDAGAADQGSIETTLGIDPEWDEDRIKGHLRKEFKKWNDRLSALPEGEERNNAQTMIDLISRARKQYD